MPTRSHHRHLHRSDGRALRLAGILLCLGLFQGAGISLAGEPVRENISTRLSGTVTDPDGRPIPGVSVCLVAGNNELRDQTDALGQYDFSIAPGVWNLFAHMEHYTSFPAEVLTMANTETKKDLVLTPRVCLVSGHVIDAAGVTGSIHAPAGLDIIGPDPPVASNRSQITFQCVAGDTSGRKQTICPRWGFEPLDAGEVSCSRDGQSVTYSPHSDFIGQVRISLTDTLTGETVRFNAAEGLPECDRGLAVYHLLCGDAAEATVGDGQGFRLIIPQAAIPRGDTTLIFLRKPRVPEVKRITPGHQVWGQIYDLASSDDVAFVRPLELVLPIVPESGSRETFIGRWSSRELEWEPIQGTAAAGEISAQADQLCQFAVLSVSEPLVLNGIQLLPNPFTPNDPDGLQLGFTLSSNQARKPFVTIRIYNMTGQLVRTICENEPVSKGAYPPGAHCPDSRGIDITVWDGRTDSGDLARNGRYLVHLRADDLSGTVEKLSSVVLIK